MWKVFLMISILVVGGAIPLSWMNKETAAEKRAERIKTQNTLAERRQELADTKDNLAKTEASILKLEDEAKALQAELAIKQAEVTEQEGMLQSLKTTLASVQEKLEQAREIQREFPQLEQLKMEMVQLRGQIDQLGIEITGLQNKIATTKVQRDGLQKVADELAALKEDQDAGRIRGEFASTIKRAYNNWGFVIIEGGNEQGIVNRAQLDVVRRGQQVCKLIVTAVEPGESVAEVIPGSMAPGQTIQQGDLVKKTDNPIQTQNPADGAETLIPGGAAPDAGAPAIEDPFGGGGDPFGGGAMEGGAPPADDPFGGGGGAMEEAPAGAMEAPANGGATEPDPFQ